MVATRLRNQGLAGSLFRRPEDVVAWLGAVQAQDYAGARWALGQRVKGATDQIVRQAFDDGRILRTHVLRPTWHFVAPADLRWMLSVTAPRVHAANGFSYRANGLDTKTLTRGADVVCRALEGGRHLTRAELATALARRRLPSEGQALAYVVMHAELEGLICSGPVRGKQFTYALVNERVPRTPALGADEALAALALRYFSSHGPATLRDFAWWAGLTVAQARAAIDGCDRGLVAISLDGRQHWWTPGAARRSSTAPHRVYLLPNYDEFLIAFKDRHWTTAPSTAAPRFGPAAGHPHQLLIEGLVEGAWRRTLSTSTVTVEVVPYRALTQREREGLYDAVDRYSAFLGLPATLRLEPPAHAAGVARPGV